MDHSRANNNNNNNCYNYNPPGCCTVCYVLGPQGPQGVRGNTGATGPQGPTGPTGVTGAGPSNLVDGNNIGAVYGVGSVPGYTMGEYALAIGQNTVASGKNAVSMGENTVASGKNAVAIGENTVASGDNSFAQGLNTEASGFISHAEGASTVASGEVSHAEGDSTTASGFAAHAEGDNTTASEEAAHAEGSNTTASGFAAHAEGNNTTASGFVAHAEGNNTTASGFAAHAEGNNTTASSNVAHAEGSNTTASGNGAHAEGTETIASGSEAHAEGFTTTASGNTSHAEGTFTVASGENAHAQGRSTEADSLNSSAAGLDTSTDGVEGAFVVGRYGGPNDAINGTPATKEYGFYVANGSNPGTRGLSAMILNDGNAYAGTWNNGGADYGEMFESLDGKPIEPGYFVTLARDGKIRIANSEDAVILGITSKTAGVIGNNNVFHWEGKYLKDEWGTIIYNNAHQPILNPEWDSEQVFKSRQEREEWVVVGLLGQILVRDDGTCDEGKYCRVTDDGIATMAEVGYPVLKRVKENQILVMCNSIETYKYITGLKDLLREQKKTFTNEIKSIRDELKRVNNMLKKIVGKEISLNDSPFDVDDE